MESLLQILDAPKPKAPHPIYRFFSDPVVVALVIMIGVLTLVDSAQVNQSLIFTLKAMLSIAPYFVLALAFAGAAKATGIDAHIARVFSGKSWITIIAASLAGALSPFCSCGVIPLIAAMLASGVPLGPVMAFCIASPIMDPELFILTASGISIKFAIAKTIAAIGMGLAAGFTVFGLQRLGFLHQPLKQGKGGGCCQSTFDPKAEVKVNWRFWQNPAGSKLFWAETRSNGTFLGKWMILAFFLESLMIAYIPADWIGGEVGQQSAFAIPLASVVGIPAYMNGYAAIPLVSGLMEIGMSPGAAMAFITSGAVSSIPAALAVYALVRKPVFLLYIVLGLSGSMLAGYIFQISFGA